MSCKDCLYCRTVSIPSRAMPLLPPETRTVCCHPYWRESGQLTFHRTIYRVEYRPGWCPLDRRGR